MKCPGSSVFMGIFDSARALYQRQPLTQSAAVAGRSASIMPAD